MLSAFVMFACTNDNNANNGDNGKDPQNPDKPKPSEMRYVSKITQTEIYTDPIEKEEVTQMIFEYDAQNRVVKMNVVFTEDQQVNPVAIQYETGKVKAIVSGSWTEESEMVDGVVPGEKKSFKNTATGTLNADGYIESGECIYTVTDGQDYKTTWGNTYNEGYLQRVTTAEDDKEEPYVNNCLWTAGNMISITDNKGETRSTATYDTKNLNNPKCNLDLNWIVYYDEFFATLDESVFDVLGYYGKRSANMVTSTKNKHLEYTLEYTYEYTYDAAGLVTKVVTKDVKTNKICATVVIEYK